MTTDESESDEQERSASSLAALRGALVESENSSQGAAARLGVQRVRKAYEQVADQIRDLIMSGQLEHGARLPNETVLAGEFGVSRATVREALRTLAAQRLVVTAKGAGGGTYVTLPSFDYVSELLHANISLLAELHHITLEELLEARMHLEVPAARLAAARRTDEDVERLNASVPDDLLEFAKKERFSLNVGFHSVVASASGNAFLRLSALPLFTVLQTNLSRSSFSDTFHRDIMRDHVRIARAIADQDEEKAGTLMTEHLQFLQPHYERTWRHARRAKA